MVRNTKVIEKLFESYDQDVSGRNATCYVRKVIMVSKSGELALWLQKSDSQLKDSCHRGNSVTKKPCRTWKHIRIIVFQSLKTSRPYAVRVRQRRKQGDNC